MLNKIRSITAKILDLQKTISLIWDASHYWTLAWIILLVVLGFLPVGIIYSTKSVVNSLVAVVGVGISSESIHSLLVPVAIMASLMLMGGLMQSVMELVRTAQSEYVRDHISALVQQKSITLDLAVYESSEYHDKLNRARSNASNTSLSLLESLGNLLQNSITLLSMAAILIPYGIWIPFVLLTSTLPALYIVFYFNRRYHRWWQKSTTARRRLQYYESLLTSDLVASELRLFNFGSHFQQAYQRLTRQLRTERLRMSLDKGLGRFATSFVALLIFGGVMGWTARKAILGQMNLGDLALLFQAFNQAQNLMRSVLGNLGQIYKNSLFVSNLFEFLQLEPKIVDPLEPHSVPEKLQHGINFRHVTFHYPGSNLNVLENFNLHIPAGKIVAIVGDNGAGKSTLIKLLCRFYDPEAGSIELDNTDIREFSIEQYRRLITVLFQFPGRYQVTAAQNIAMGDLSAAYTQADIEIAAQDAGIHQKITRLSEGYDSQLGKYFPGGTDLSGGEWQRLALARAFLRRAQIIILDEPTSAMDPWAEFNWLERFRQLANGRTSIVITHRFTLAMRADIIHVMREGQIVESGSHKELLAKKGFYAESWKQQMQTKSNESVESFDALLH